MMKKSYKKTFLVICVLTIVLGGCNSNKTNNIIIEKEEAEIVVQPEIETEVKFDSKKESEVNEKTEENPGEKVYDNWIESYSAFLLDKSNFEEWLSSGSSYSEQAFEPSHITGFTFVDLDKDDIPELVVLAQPSWESSKYSIAYEQLLIYSFDEEKGDTYFVTNIRSTGYVKDFQILNENESIMLCDSYDCVAGMDGEGNLIVFSNWGDVSYGWCLFKVDIHNEGGNRYTNIYTEDFNYGTNEKDYENGDSEEARKILNEYTPIMFFDITTENIDKYIVENYKELGMLNYSREEVVDYLTKKNEEFDKIDTSNIQIDGLIENRIAYNIDYLMQWNIYSK